MLHSLCPDTLPLFLISCFLSSLHKPSPPSALLSHPLPAPPSSTPPIIGSPFIGTTHHRLHVIDATFNSQVRFLIFLTFFRCSPSLFVRDCAPGLFFKMLGQTHVNGWSHVIASQNGNSTSYIFPFRLRVLQ